MHLSNTGLVSHCRVSDLVPPIGQSMAQRNKRGPSSSLTDPSGDIATRHPLLHTFLIFSLTCLCTQISPFSAVGSADLSPRNSGLGLCGRQMPSAIGTEVRARVSSHRLLTTVTNSKHQSINHRLNTTRRGLTITSSRSGIRLQHPPQLHEHRHSRGH